VGAIGERLKEERLRNGWSQKDLAQESKTNVDTISGIETGQHEPRPSTLRKLARALGIEVRDLFEEPALLGKFEAPETGPTGTPQEWAQAHSARLHGMSDEEWDAHIRELESADEIQQEFRILRDEAKDLHAAYGGDRWLNPENQEDRKFRARRLREIRTDRLADLASAAAKNGDQVLLKRVTEALFKEAHS
jgi:transcriptional regulator with XRE-family HTH domain